MATLTEKERLAAIECELATERPHLATKADIAKLEATLTWRMILIGVAIQALGIGVLKFSP